MPMGWSGAGFHGIGPCDAAGGYFISNVSGMAAMYHHPAWVPGVSDANSLMLIGPRPSGQLAFISDLADGNAEFPGIEPLGQVQMTGQWRPTGASVQHLFRMTQCLTDHDLDGVPGTLADVAAFMADHLANSLRADINGDNALDAADIAAFNALMAAGLGC